MRAQAVILREINTTVALRAATFRPHAYSFIDLPICSADRFLVDVFLSEGLKLIMTKLRLVLLATTAFGVTQIAVTASHASNGDAPILLAQAAPPAAEGEQKAAPKGPPPAARRALPDLDVVRSKYQSKTESFEIDLPWGKRDALEITIIKPKGKYRP